MFWRNKWESLGVKKKIFITNTLLIGISFILLYTVIYVFMPKVYNTYKMNKIYANISELRTELSENEHIDLYEVLDENTENGMSNIVYSSERQDSKQINIPSGNSTQKPNDFKFEANRDKLGKEKMNFNDQRAFGNADKNK